MEDLYRPSNEAEAMVIQAVLREEGIESQFRSFRDTAFDGALDPQRGSGVVRVEGRDLAQAREILEAWLAALPEPEPSDIPDPPDEPAGDAGADARRKFFSFWVALWPIGRTLVVWISIALNVGFFVKYVWRRGADVEHLRDSRGIRVATFFYRPLASRPYRTISYSADGERISESIDDDENGWHERHVEYRAGRKIGESLDDDEDGIVNRALIFREGRLVVETWRRSPNGMDDRATAFDESGRAIASLFDRDDDGLLEEIQCADARGIRHTWNTRRCALDP